jgi:hypothetical protein
LLAVDSEKRLVTFTVISPFKLTQPLSTALLRLRHGMHRPSRGKRRLAQAPLVTTPSSGMRSPALTTISSPGSTSAAKP